MSKIIMLQNAANLQASVAPISFLNANAATAKTAPSYGSRDDLLVRYNSKGKASLVPHNLAAEILHKKLFNSLLYHDSITGEWLQYQECGIFKVRPNLSVRAEIYKAINAHCGDLGFSAGYESGVSHCVQREAVREPSTPNGLICFKNGVLDLATQQLLPHSPKYFFTSQLPFDWEPNTSEPQLIIDWLRESVGGHDDQVQLLRAWFHAILVGRPDLQRFLEIVGFGGSGKGTFTRLCIAMVGAAATHTTGLSALETNRFETAKVLGKKLVIITDAEKWHGDVSVLKSLTGQDPVRFEEKHRQAGDSFTYGGMVLIAANQHTASTDYSSGIQRRRITLHFDHVVAAEQRRELNIEFEPYLPALVKWALDMPEEEVTGYLRSTGDRVRSLLNVQIETLTATNPIIAWLMDRCRFDPNRSSQIGSKREISISEGEGIRITRKEFVGANERLYPSYLDWCASAGKTPISLVNFSRTVIDAARNSLGKSYVDKARQAGNGATVIKGLILKESTLLKSVKSCEELTEGQPIDCEECEECEELLEPIDLSSSPSSACEASSDVFLSNTNSNHETSEPTPQTLHILHNQELVLHEPFTNPSRKSLQTMEPKGCSEPILKESNPSFSNKKLIKRLDSKQNTLGGVEKEYRQESQHGH